MSARIAPHRGRQALILVVAAALLGVAGGVAPAGARPTAWEETLETGRSGARPQLAETGLPNGVLRKLKTSSSRPVPPPPVAPPDPPPPPPEPPPPSPARHFAGVDNLQLRLPGGVTQVGFHESADRRALALHPVGRPRINDNLPRIANAPVNHDDGPDYIIMNTRRRAMPATSAVDLAMPPNWPVQSPVTGTVAWVDGYLLYGRHSDYMVTIIPDARPDLRVVLLHLDVVHVPPGHRVVAGETIIASTARLLPFASQIDRYAGHGPHVHVEVRRPG